MTLTFKTIVPSQVTVESSNSPVLGTIGDRLPIVTQTTSQALLVEVTVTPGPDPTVGHGYTRQGTLGDG